MQKSGIDCFYRKDTKTLSCDRFKKQIEKKFKKSCDWFKKQIEKKL